MRVSRKLSRIETALWTVAKVPVISRLTSFVHFPNWSSNFPWRLTFWCKVCSPLSVTLAKSLISRCLRFEQVLPMIAISEFPIWVLESFSSVRCSDAFLQTSWKNSPLNFDWLRTRDLSFLHRTDKSWRTKSVFASADFSRLSDFRPWNRKIFKFNLQKKIFS